MPAILDEDDVIRRVTAWLGGLKPDRIEGLWEVVALLAAARTLGADLRAVGALPPLPEASPGPTLSPSSAGARAAAIEPIEG